MPEPTIAEVVNLSPEEENRVKEFSQKILGKAAVGIVTYPLTFAKTLHQIGHEPFALTTGKVFVVAGRDAYFLPNTFKYCRFKDLLMFNLPLNSSEKRLHRARIQNPFHRSGCRNLVPSHWRNLLLRY